METAKLSKSQMEYRVNMINKANLTLGEQEAFRQILDSYIFFDKENDELNKEISHLQSLPEKEKILDTLKFFKEVASTDFNDVGKLHEYLIWIQNETKRFLHEVK